MEISNSLFLSISNTQSLLLTLNGTVLTQSLLDRKQGSLFVYLLHLFSLSASSSINPSLPVSQLLTHTLKHTHLDVDVERARADSVPTGERVQKVDAVGVIFLQGGHVKVSLLPRRPP